MLRFDVGFWISDVVVFLFRRGAWQLFALRGVLSSGFPRLRFGDRFRGLTAAGGLDQERVWPLELRPSAVLATVTAGAALPVKRNAIDDAKSTVGKKMKDKTNAEGKRGKKLNRHAVQRQNY